MQSIPPFAFSLKKRKASHRDYSFHKTLGLGISYFPSELILASPIGDQGVLDQCTAFAATAIRFNETNKNYDPQVFWNQELAFAGETTNTNGFTLQVPLATAVEKGFPNDAPSAYYWITPNNGQDLFDSCRSAMLQQNRPLMAGVEWDTSWTYAQGAIITSTSNSPLGGHCVKIAGFKTINNIPYIIVQNSWGIGFGDSGLYYFARDVFNQAFPDFGVAMWSDSQDVKIKTLGLLAALYQNLLTLLSR